MDIELHRQRRNLIAISLGLIIFEMAGGQVKAVSFMNGGVSLENPGLLISLGYLALAYSLWRYWLYVKPEHDEFRKLVQKTLEDSPLYREFVGPLVKKFREESGVAHADGWQEFSYDELQKEFVLTPVEEHVTGNFLTRELVLQVQNPKGDFNPDRVAHRMPEFSYERMKASAWTKVILGEKEYSDLFVPYLLAFSAVGLLLWRVLSA